MLAIGWLSITSGIASKLLSYIGKYSYFIYFVHFLILDLLVTGVQKFKIESDFLLSQKIYFVAFYLITLATSILLAIPSMKFFEKPFTNLSKPKNRQPIKVSVQKNT
jgi:peptidoglycan/LPS O-acetylase OafA/YrhL